MMKFIILSLIVVSFTHVHAQDNECLKRIQQELKTESEKYLFENHKKVQQVFELKCAETDFGNTLYSQDAFVFIHEAAHFEDLNWDANDLTGIDKDNPAKKFNLYTVDNEHIGNFQSYKNLPAIKDLVRPYLEKEKTAFLIEDSIFMGMHDGYIGAEDSIAADIIQGMATELNGYTHGALVQSRVLPKLPNPVVFKDENGDQHTMDNPYVSLPSQTDGIMYFLYNFNLYLRLLKQDHPLAWKEFYNSYNKEYLNRLFTPSIEVLKKLSHCSLMKSYGPIKFYIEELRKDDLSIFEEILGEEKLGALICSNDSLKSTLETLNDKKESNNCEQ